MPQPISEVAVAGQPIPADAKPAPMADATKLKWLGAGGLAVMLLVLAIAPGGGNYGETGFFAFTAGLIFVMAGWWIVNLSPARPASAIDQATADRLEKLLALTLAELEQTRADTIRRVKRRAILLVPLGIGAGLAFSLMPNHDRASTIINDLFHAGIGGFLGFGWAASKPANAYRCLYKERVLPQLAALFGKLDYRAAVTPDLAILRSEDVLPAYDITIAEDEIFGSYRDLALNIVELKLRRHGGKTDYTVFDGLLTSIELPRKLVGTTAVVAGGSLMGGLSALLGDRQHQRVSIEDPVFAKAYTVYGSDQIAARALLTPAFMERFLALGQRAGFGRPVALARDNLLTIILPKSGSHDLFEPPSYLTPAAGAAALVKLYDDIAAVLDVADAVIGLDQGSRAVASRAAAQG